MASHTPAPWGIGYIIEGGFQIHGTSEGDKFVITTRTPISLKMQDESEANARLIAAAPELLAALKRIRACYDSSDSAEDFGQRFEIDVVVLAIAKAEGRG